MNWADAETAISKRLTRPLHDEANVFLVETNGVEKTEAAMQKVQKILASGIIKGIICSLPTMKFMGLSQNTLRLVLGVIAVLFLLLAINAQWTAVSERHHEIAILKAIGWGDQAIFRQIIVESIIVAVSGSIAGAITGLIAFTAVSTHMGLKVNLAYEAINAPIAVIAIIAVSLIAGIVSALGPAISAARTSPAEVFRTL
jgi:ABC-type antimicrobial peptide transport system permease subunit